ncbi:hypothetical protein LOK49_LG09G02716 [Camellia lanceoleosa]|uniref:Uncharacterized protein n=1 Tax=Camellia lanceoleosa TaxID=1840588 RepID=A0ACC0GIU6_9ERIC|nr:hypothetical protein LOK49_LG09G02716 [Camellia lanceoleosa]
MLIWELSLIRMLTGTTIVTDSVTSDGLTTFIEKKLGGKHHRFKRGYKNVIDEAIRLVKLLNKLASARASGVGGGSKVSTDLVDSLEEPAVTVEFRLTIDQSHPDLKGGSLKHLENVTDIDPKLQKAPVNYEDWSCWHTGDGAKSLIDASDRLILYVEVARLFGTLGYHRKVAFFSRQVAQLYLQQENRPATISALQVLAMTTKAYRVQSRASIARSSLPSILFFAWSAADALRSYSPLITPPGKNNLASELANSADRLPSGTHCADPASPFIRLHSFPLYPSQMDIIKRNPAREDWWAGSGPSGPFIYTPFDKESQIIAAHISLSGKSQESVLSLPYETLKSALPLKPSAEVTIPRTLKAWRLGLVDTDIC